MADNVYDLPELYDLISPRDADMERFYVDVAGGPGRRVLELACGTGRLTLPLAQSGATVTGGDLSESMLASARQKAAEQQLAVDFVALDMRDFDVGQRFDVVMVAANSLLHLYRTEDLHGFFSAVARHLVPGGRLIFDIFVPSAQLLSAPPDARQPLAEFPHPQLGTITVEETIAYDAITQVSHIDWYWSTAAQRDFKHTPMQLRQIYPQELPLLLERDGFRLVERFGDFDRSLLTSGSMRQVSICAALDDAVT